MKIQYLEKNSDYTEVLSVLLQLVEPKYNLDSLAVQVDKQISMGYQVIYVKSEQGILGVAGFYVGEKLAWGKHIYIESLVTNSLFRSRGVGKFLIDWFKSYALENDCEQIHLDSRVHRFLAHKFYLREGFNIASHHFSIVEVQQS